jgi:hypothetical protein
VQLTVDVIATALMRYHIHTLSSEGVLSRRIQLNPHDSPPSYYQANAMEPHSILGPRPWTSASLSTSGVTPEASIISETIKAQLEMPPSALSLKHPRGSYFNFMTSLVSLYSTREPALDLERRALGSRHISTLPISSLRSVPSHK